VDQWSGLLTSQPETPGIGPAGRRGRPAAQCTSVPIRIVALTCMVRQGAEATRFFTLFRVLLVPGVLSIQK
jgi:hypothetical protein